MSRETRLIRCDFGSQIFAVFLPLLIIIEITDTLRITQFGDFTDIKGVSQVFSSFDICTLLEISKVLAMQKWS